MEDGSCRIMGCTDPNSASYVAAATDDDGSCERYVAGCMDPTAHNYRSTATVDDGSCYEYVSGCMDSAHFADVDASATVLDVTTRARTLRIPTRTLHPCEPPPDV